LKHKKYKTQNYSPTEIKSSPQNIWPVMVELFNVYFTVVNRLLVWYGT